MGLVQNLEYMLIETGPYSATDFPYYKLIPARSKKRTRELKTKIVLTTGK
jgi:hypothetical protein